MAETHQKIVTFWHNNQVSITFQSSLDESVGTDAIIKSLGLERFNEFLSKSNLTLTPFNENDVPHPPSLKDEANAYGYVDDDDDDLNSPTGKYLFPSPSGGTTVVSYFHIEPTGAVVDPTVDNTVTVVNLINDNKQLFVQDTVQAVSAMPHWLNGGTQNFVSHGCPINPPYPFTDPCNSGRWTTTFPQSLPDSLSGKTGDGVRVLVLDTLPVSQQIVTAGDQNLLLKDMATGMVSNPPFNAQPPSINHHYTNLPVVLDVPGNDQPATGKDIYGRLVGFPMADHGLFVAGIIRDLARGAEIECIRVLNDLAIGDTVTLTAAFRDIVDRTSLLNPVTGSPGDLYNKPIVINLSLVATPADEEIVNFDIHDVESARAGLLAPIQILAARGVVFVASAGNDSNPMDPNDPPDPHMMMTKCRLGPRYPAAFAYHQPDPVGQMIPVGAVDQNGKATLYSNYPGSLGIATYGGGGLKPQEPVDEPHDVTHVLAPIDAVRGVYSSPLYPALSEFDVATIHSDPPPNYPEYEVPANSNAWVYWSGTSFATPIISALAARAMQGLPANSVDVHETIIAAAGQNTTTWTRLKPDNADPNYQCSEDENCYEDNCKSGPLIMAVQICQPNSNPPIQ